MSRRVRWALAGLFAGAYLVVSLTVARGYVLTAFGDLTQCGLLLFVFSVFLRNAFAGESRVRLFWAFMALGCGMWFAAQGLWTLFEVFLRREVPNPFVGDVILFLHLVPMMGALALQPHLEHDEQASRLGALDFIMLIVWWLYLYVFVVIPWQYVSPNEARYGTSFDLAYFLEHFVFVACAVTACVRSSAAWRPVYRILFAASLVYALGSMASSVAIDFGKYYTGSYFDMPLVISMLLFAELALAAGHTSLRPVVPHEAHKRIEMWVSGLAMTTILSLPLLAGWAFYLSDAPAEVRNFRLLATLAAMFIMGTLVWVKQHRTDEQLARRNRELREDSLTDPLTRCRNRRFFDNTVEPDVRHVIRSYSRVRGTPEKRNQDLAFYLIDCDSFKEINDLYGHDVGDRVLVEMTRRISSAIRHSDVLIRWGGDEFMVVSRYTDRAETATLANRVLNNVAREPFDIEGVVELPRTCSIGWAVFPWFAHEPDLITYEQIVRLADGALYQAKEAGRNCAVGLLPTLEACPENLRWVKGVKSEKLAEHLAPRRLVSEGPGARPRRETPAGKAASGSAVAGAILEAGLGLS